MNFVPCVKWVQKGVAKANPEKIKLSPEELKKLIAEERQKEVEEEEDEREEEYGDDTQDKEGKKSEDEYNMKDYDKEDTTLRGAIGLGSVALLEEDHDASKRNQNRIKLDESDSELDDEKIQDDDNLLLIGHVQDEMNILEVYVYNHEFKDLYVHHDILLPGIPLCFEWLGYDPGTTEKSNLVAIGDLGPIIKVWDVDIIDCLKPAFILGSKKKEPKSGYKHYDAVLDIAWNTNAAHILASGSVDNTILLWDLDELVATTKMSHSQDKIQVVKWHPQEIHTLLTGSADHVLRIYDCRTYDSFLSWKLNGEIEKGIWNPICPFSCFVGTNNGSIYNIDVRNNKPIWELEAFDKEITGLYVTENIPDKLYASCNGEILKVYENIKDQPTLVTQKQINVGEILCMEGNPNFKNIVALGGTKRCKNMTVVNVETIFNKDKVENDDDEEEEEDSDIDDVEGFFGIQNNPTAKKNKKHKVKLNESIEPFIPTPFSHLDEHFVKSVDPSVMKSKKFVKKQKKNIKSVEKIKKKKKQEKYQRNHDMLQKKNKKN